jgi:hypothetical protein
MGEEPRRPSRRPQIGSERLAAGGRARNRAAHRPKSLPGGGSSAACWPPRSAMRRAWGTRSLRRGPSGQGWRPRSSCAAPARRRWRRPGPARPRRPARAPGTPARRPDAPWAGARAPPASGPDSAPPRCTTAPVVERADEIVDCHDTSRVWPKQTVGGIDGNGCSRPALRPASGRRPARDAVLARVHPPADLRPGGLEPGKRPVARAQVVVGRHQVRPRDPDRRLRTALRLRVPPARRWRPSAGSGWRPRRPGVAHPIPHAGRPTPSTRCRSARRSQRRGMPAMLGRDRSTTDASVRSQSGTTTRKCDHTVPEKHRASSIGPLLVLPAAGLSSDLVTPALPTSGGSPARAQVAARARR